MSRIGKSPVSVPDKVEITTGKDNLVTVKGPKGSLSQQLSPDFKIEIEGNTATVVRPGEDKQSKALHGLYRSLLSNMVKGVTEGYKIDLELVGVGYKATATGNILELSLGYSHGIFLILPQEVAVKAVTDKGKNPIVTLEGTDKQLLGHMASKIRSLRKVEPYKGKGVRFVGEKVRRKAGKTAAK